MDERTTKLPEGFRLLATDWQDLIVRVMLVDDRAGTRCDRYGYANDDSDKDNAVAGAIADAVAQSTGEYGALEVISDCGRYYIGRVWTARDEAGNIRACEPGSRDSGYYRTYEEAERALKLLMSSRH